MQNHVILSGGLGQSKYVFDKLSQHLRSTGANCLRGTELRQSIEPQLCVCLGLVYEALQANEAELEMFPHRVANFSCGISGCVRYESMVLFNDKIKDFQDQANAKDLIFRDNNGDRWIENGMTWFVKKVSKVPLPGDSSSSSMLQFQQSS